MNSVNQITPSELVSLLDESENLVVIDVREAKEVAQGMIEDAIHIPLQDIPSSMNEWNKNKHYVFVCKSGVRSLHAASYLGERGYRVSNMTGGMIDWKEEVFF